MLYSSTGVLRYSPEGIKLTLEVEQSLADYYKKLIPFWYKVERQRYGAHISVVRRETPPKMEFWRKYEGETVEFYYESEIRFGEVYFWLDCYSLRLEEIRDELGLNIKTLLHPGYTVPPPGFSYVFHMTIGNRKAL